MFFVGTGHFIEDKNSKEGWVPTWTHTKEKCYWSKGQKKKKKPEWWAVFKNRKI